MINDNNTAQTKGYKNKNLLITDRLDFVKANKNVNMVRKTS